MPPAQRHHCRRAALALAAGLALPCSSLAQDSTATSPGSRGDAFDAYRAATDPNDQIADFVVDLTPIDSSWRNRYAIAPLLKSSRTTGANPSGTILPFNHLISSQAASPTMTEGLMPRPSYLAWRAAGQGVAAPFNAAPADDGSGRYGLLEVGAQRAWRFGAAMLEFGEGPDLAFGTGDDENNIIAATVALQARRTGRLFVSRITALTNKVAAGAAGANTATASFGLGAVDDAANVHVLADGFGLLAPGRLTDKRLLRVAAAAREQGVINVLSNTASGDPAATTMLGGVPAGALLTTPAIIPASVASRPVLLASDFASNLLHESAPGDLTATRSHLPTPAGSSRGNLSYIAQTFAPLCDGIADAGTGATLSRTDDNTTTRGISIFGLNTDGSVDLQRQLILPTSGLTDPADGFDPAAVFPTLAEHEFTSYQSQVPFRGGNGQVALAVLPGGDLLAAALVSATGHPGAVPASPDNYIAVVRVPASGGPGTESWTIAAHTGDAAGAAGNLSKAILQDADNDGVLDPTPIGRLALRSEVPPGSPTGPSISAPAMDRAGNLYFLASVRLDLGPDTTFTTALIRANYDPTLGPPGGAGGYRLELLAKVGDVIRGANSTLDYRIEYLGVTDADSADSGAIWSGSIMPQRLPLVSAGPLPYASPLSLGALLVRARILYDVNGDGQFIDPTTPGNSASPDQPYNAMMILMPHIPPGDVNRDGAVNSADVSAFLTLWITSLTTQTTTGDWNADGAVNSADISAFLTDWIASLA